MKGAGGWGGRMVFLISEMQPIPLDGSENRDTKYEFLTAVLSNLHPQARNKLRPTTFAI